MSQFDFPRINFTGKLILDTPTANNGNYEPSLTLFDQDNSKAFIPPRCYLNPKKPFQVLPFMKLEKDENGNEYVPILPINDDNYNDWAVTPLGTFAADSDYMPLYQNLGIDNKNPGYWNYFGDVSFSATETYVKGITTIDNNNNVTTYSESNIDDCPGYLKDLLGAELSFNDEFFSPDARTTAYFCDADSIGQMCTQLFCSTAGLYKKGSGNQNITFFKGTPIKSTARWMNLNKVLNYSDQSLIPMGGSAVFYTKMESDEQSILSNMVMQATGKSSTSFYLRLMVHRVYEVRNPDYSKVPTQGIYDRFGNQSNVPKNPAVLQLTGSITPWVDGDMENFTPSRILKSTNLVTLNTKGIPVPVTKGNKELTLKTNFYLAPVQFRHSAEYNLVSFDLLNTINEYGINPDNIPAYAGNNDIAPFKDFESYNFGTLNFNYKIPGINNRLIGSLTYQDYLMEKIINNGGIFDFRVNDNDDFRGGNFNMEVDKVNYLSEIDYLILTNETGNYAQQNQTDNNYMNKGLPKKPCTLHIYYRGRLMDEGQKVKVTTQVINMRTNTLVSSTDSMMADGEVMNFNVSTDGCLTYAFIGPGDTLLADDLYNIFNFIMQNGLVVVRTLADDTHLDPYINGTLPITWDVVYKEVFQLFKLLYPVMNAIVPFNEQNWSSKTLLSRMLLLMDDSNWNQPLYMPVTRDLTAKQQQLLKVWVNHISNK